MRYRTASLVVAAFLLAACKPAASTAETQPAAPAAAPVETAAVPASVQPGVEAGFTQNMAYATLRGKLIDAGWLPLSDPMCRENVGGEALVCGELPEAESCSGDGHCVMNFANAGEGKRIRVTTYGPFERWNTPGEESALAVKSWKISASDAVAQAAAPACPSRDFDAFLKAFASDNSIERAFTAPVVKVAQLGGGEDGDDTVLVYQSAANYADFNVEYDGKAFHYVDAKGSRDAASLELKVEPQGENARTVRYQYGMSEGNSYTFENNNGCWYLTQDPEPPSP